MPGFVQDQEEKEFFSPHGVSLGMFSGSAPRAAARRKRRRALAAETLLGCPLPFSPQEIKTSELFQRVNWKLLNRAEALLEAGGEEMVGTEVCSVLCGRRGHQPSRGLFPPESQFKNPSPFSQPLVLCDIRKAESWFSSKKSYLTSFDRHLRPLPPRCCRPWVFITFPLPLFKSCSPGAGAAGKAERGLFSCFPRCQCFYRAVELHLLGFTLTLSFGGNLICSDCRSESGNPRARQKQGINFITRDPLSGFFFSICHFRKCVLFHSRCFNSSFSFG